MIGDVHVYNDHIESLQEQLSREPRPFPKLVINRKVESIDDFKSDDFEVEGYYPHASIKMKMVV